MADDLLKPLLLSDPIGAIALRWAVNYNFSGNVSLIYFPRVSGFFIKNPFHFIDDRFFFILSSRENRSLDLINCGPGSQNL